MSKIDEIAAKEYPQLYIDVKSNPLVDLSWINRILFRMYAEKKLTQHEYLTATQSLAGNNGNINNNRFSGENNG